jgi:hypothetical protein
MRPLLASLGMSTFYALVSPMALRQEDSTLHPLQLVEDAHVPDLVMHGGSNSASISNNPDPQLGLRCLFGKQM